MRIKTLFPIAVLSSLVALCGMDYYQNDMSAYGIFTTRTGSGQNISIITNDSRTVVDMKVPTAGSGRYARIETTTFPVSGKNLHYKLKQKNVVVSSTDSFYYQFYRSMGFLKLVFTDSSVSVSNNTGAYQYISDNTVGDWVTWDVYLNSADASHSYCSVYKNDILQAGGIGCGASYYRYAQSSYITIQQGGANISGETMIDDIQVSSYGHDYYKDFSNLTNWTSSVAGNGNVTIATINSAPWAKLSVPTPSSTSTASIYCIRPDNDFTNKEIIEFQTYSSALGDTFNTTDRNYFYSNTVFDQSKTLGLYFTTSGITRKTASSTYTLINNTSFSLNTKYNWRFDVDFLNRKISSIKRDGITLAENVSFYADTSSYNARQYFHLYGYNSTVDMSVKYYRNHSEADAVFYTSQN